LRRSLRRSRPERRLLSVAIAHSLRCDHFLCGDHASSDLHDASCNECTTRWRERLLSGSRAADDLENGNRINRRTTAVGYRYRDSHEEKFPTLEPCGCLGEGLKIQIVNQRCAKRNERE